MNTFDKKNFFIPNKSQCGVTMIEALISLLLFSVGALGLAAMQLSTMTTSGDNMQRSTAIWKAQEFADRIRSNPALVTNYIEAINNDTLRTLGVDNSDNLVICEAASPYITPPVRCADYVDNAGNIRAGQVCTNDQQVAFDVWEVFCDTNTGLATRAPADGNVANGSVGLINLEVVLRQVVPGGDVELYFEWLSGEGEATADVDTKITAELCGRDDDGDGNVDSIDIDSRLDVYCLRFRP